MSGWFDTEFVLCKRNHCSSHWSLETGFKSVEDLDARAREVRGLDKQSYGYLVTTTFFPTLAIYPNWIKSMIGRYHLWQTVKVE